MKNRLWIVDRRWFIVAFDGVRVGKLFEEEKPFASSAIWACVVYSLMPFVGVVFVPFVLIFGVVGLVRGESTFRAMAAAVGILVVQLVLWWLLYVVPKWGLQV